MGEAVGALVGFLVGFLVGVAVGLVVGFAVGLKVGVLVVGFCLVGLTVGFKRVGLGEVGFEVGFLDVGLGEDVGDIVGARTPPPQAQHASLAVIPPLEYVEDNKHCCVSLAYHIQLYLTPRES